MRACVRAWPRACLIASFVYVACWLNQTNKSGSLRDISKHDQRIGLDVKRKEVSRVKKKTKKTEEYASEVKRGSNGCSHEMSINVPSSLMIHPSTRISRAGYFSSTLKLVYCDGKKIQV